jgi:hypothetical protein
MANSLKTGLTPKAARKPSDILNEVVAGTSRGRTAPSRNGGEHRR